MKIIEVLLPGAQQVRGYSERLLKDIQVKQFARKPVVGGLSVDTNHPAFVYGHLSIYPVQLARMLSIDPTEMVVPESFPGMFSMTATCKDDPNGTIYPEMSVVTGAFFKATDALLAALPAIDEKLLTVRLEDPKRQERFGSVGAFLAYILLAHPQVHLGQISTWRRCMGLGPA